MSLLCTVRSVSLAERTRVESRNQQSNWLPNPTPYRLAYSSSKPPSFYSLSRFTHTLADQLAESSGRRLARRDIAVLKAILCQGLYPHFAVADAGNAGRASNEQQYITRPSAGLFMSPSSVLACQDFGVRAGGGGAAGGGGGAGMGWRGSGNRSSADVAVASRGAAADAGRGDGLLCYGSVMETQRPFLSSVTPLPALQALLLFSARVDTSEDASLVRGRFICCLICFVLFCFVCFVCLFVCRCVPVFLVLFWGGISLYCCSFSM